MARVHHPSECDRAAVETVGRIFQRTLRCLPTPPVGVEQLVSLAFFQRNIVPCGDKIEHGGTVVDRKGNTGQM